MIARPVLATPATAKSAIGEGISHCISRMTPSRTTVTHSGRVDDFEELSLYPHVRTTGIRPVLLDSQEANHPGRGDRSQCNDHSATDERFRHSNSHAGQQLVDDFHLHLVWVALRQDSGVSSEPKPQRENARLRTITSTQAAEALSQETAWRSTQIECCHANNSIKGYVKSSALSIWSILTKLTGVSLQRKGKGRPDGESISSLRNLFCRRCICRLKG